MTDVPQDHTVAQTAEENIPTQSNPMDNIHGNVEDISNKASGYKVCTLLSISLYFRDPTPPKLSSSVPSLRIILTSLSPGHHVQPQHQH